MRIGMVGLGRMGANMVQRLIKAGHEVVVWDRSEAAVKDLASKGAIAAADQKDLVSKLTEPKLQTAVSVSLVFRVISVHKLDE